jgi:hypothetical protein
MSHLTRLYSVQAGEVVGAEENETGVTRDTKVHVPGWNSGLSVNFVAR